MTQWGKCAAQAGGPGSSSQNTCEEVRHGGAHLKSQMWGGRDGQISEAHQSA